MPHGRRSRPHREGGKWRGNSSCASSPAPPELIHLHFAPPGVKQLCSTTFCVEDYWCLRAAKTVSFNVRLRSRKECILVFPMLACVCAVVVFV